MFERQEIKRAGSEEVLRQIPAGVMIAEAPSGKIIFVNRQTQQMLEQQPDRSVPSELGELPEVHDSSGVGISHPDGRPYAFEEWPLVRSIRSGEEVRDEEINCLLADGTRLWLRCDSSPIYGDEGRIVAGVLMVRDVTERKRAEAHLVYHAHLLENLHDAVITTDEREVGAAGVLHKSVPIEDIIDTAKRLLRGEAVLSTNEIIELLRLASREREREHRAQQATERLTPREQEVLQALADGLSDKEISERLNVTIGTVRNHFVSIFNKLRVHSRLQALVFALRQGIIELGS